MNPKITEYNFAQHLADYAEWKYGKYILDSYDSGPYDLNFDEVDFTTDSSSLDVSTRE